MPAAYIHIPISKKASNRLTALSKRPHNILQDVFQAFLRGIEQ